MKIKWYTHLMKCYSATKNNQILPFAITLDALEGHHTKWNESDRQR